MSMSNSNSRAPSRTGFSTVDEEEEVLRIQTTSQDISFHHYTAQQQQRQIVSSSDDLAAYPRTTTFSFTPHRRSSFSNTSTTGIGFRRPRPLPPPDPFTLFNPPTMANMTVTENEGTCTSIQQTSSKSSASDSPFLRRLDSFRRSSTDFSISSFRPNNISILSSNNNTSNGPSSTATSVNNVEFEPDIGSDLNVDPSAKGSTSSESQAVYGNEDVIQDLKPEYARWFYKCEADRTWTPFTGYDSIRMEEHYRTILLKRQQNCADGTSSDYYSGDSHGQEHQENGSSAAEPSPEQGKSSDDIGEGESPNAIVVRGGLYEADLENWTCTAAYWPGDKCQITRGTWFYDGTWQPLVVEHAEKLELEHLGNFAGVSLSYYAQANGPSQPESPTKKANRPVINHVSFCEFHVDWTSPTEIHLFSKAASYKFVRSVGQRLGFQTWGHRLCRGYCKPASKDDRPPEISHLVFVVHGIGQKMDTGRIVRNCTSFRECVNSLGEKFFPHINETKQRAEFFPVEWRSAAKLDGDVVDSITPHKLLSLRQLLNATAMDIMYYTSPLYRTEIQNALRNELNRIYSNFVARNPDFESRGGKVSVLAHSLGAVITYDIITGEPTQMDKPMQEHVNGGSDNALLFKLEHFFCLGSPLSVFLALRWRDPSNPTYRDRIIPTTLCKRIYNVFYPTDPVAYRMEPLLHKQYINIAPLPIHTYGTTGRPNYCDLPKERIHKESQLAKQLENQVQNSIQNGFTTSQMDALSSKTAVTNAKSQPTTPTRDSNWGLSSLMKYLKSGDLNNPAAAAAGNFEAESGLNSPDASSSSPKNDDGGNSSPEDIYVLNDLGYRMDYVLKESNFASTYLAALTSHTSYWSSPDTAFFVLTHLYGDLLDAASNNS